MNPTVTAALKGAQTLAGGILAIGIGIYDAGWLHAWGKDLDLALVLGGLLGGFGIAVAYRAGLNSDPTPPK